MNDTHLKFVFKITVIGDGGVGKTSLIKKYTEGTFEEDYISTVGAQFSFYDEKINGDECKLYFWDIAGQDEFEFLRADFYEESKAAIIVYSLEENDHGKKSLDHIKKWYEDLISHCGEIPVIIFANKVDLIEENKVDNESVQNLVKEMNNFGIYRTSAKTGQGVTEAFQKIIRELYNKFKSNL
jgi:small GTP-binding protein